MVSSGNPAVDGVVNAQRRAACAGDAIRAKKGAAVAGGSKVNREASNRVDRSHSMSRSWTMHVMNEKA
jgi:hypothetical protein